jgi:ATP-dependent RNA helicase RhlE
LPFINYFNILNFVDFGFDDRLMEGIEASGYSKATPVQEQVIPIVLEGKDLIASAQTGTGKTAAFLLPIIDEIINSPYPEFATSQTLIIVPTRELAVQIAQHVEGLSYYTSVSSIAVYGGASGAAFVQEKKALSEGVDIIICTPGKMISHLNMGYVKLDGLKYLVLDEADRMLDMGFNEDIMRIIKYLPSKRQTLLFSATMPIKIREMARLILQNPKEVNISISKPNEKIVQQVFSVYEAQKNKLVSYILAQKKLALVLIFCSSKLSVKNLNRDLKKLGLPTDEIHSDLDQTQRENVLMQFKSGRLSILIATDILSRGIDIDNIDLVINYDVPHDGEDYVHRIGRTARASAEGKAITLVSEGEQHKLVAIEKLLGKKIPIVELPTQIGESPKFDPIASRKFKKPGGGKKVISKR